MHFFDLLFNIIMSSWSILTGHFIIVKNLQKANKFDFIKFLPLIDFATLRQSQNH